MATGSYFDVEKKDIFAENFGRPYCILHWIRTGKQSPDVRD